MEPAPVLCILFNDFSQIFTDVVHNCCCVVPSANLLYADFFRFSRLAVPGLIVENTGIATTETPMQPSPVRLAHRFPHCFNLKIRGLAAWAVNPSPQAGLPRTQVCGRHTGEASLQEIHSRKNREILQKWAHQGRGILLQVASDATNHSGETALCPSLTIRPTAPSWAEPEHPPQPIGMRPTLPCVESPPPQESPRPSCGDGTRA